MGDGSEPEKGTTKLGTNHGDTSAEGGGCIPVPQGWKDLDPFFSYRTGTLVLK